MCAIYLLVRRSSQYSDFLHLIIPTGIFIMMCDSLTFRVLISLRYISLEARPPVLLYGYGMDIL